MNTHAQALVLGQELDWLAALVDCRFREQFLQEGEEQPEIPAAPSLAGYADTPYSAFLRRHKMEEEERLLLVLAAAPMLRPDLLDMLFAQNSALGRGFSVFGAAPGHAGPGFQPTLQTALWLLGGRDLRKRIDLGRWVNPAHWLFAEQAIRIDAQNGGWLGGALQVGDEFVARVLLGHDGPVTFSSEFPAELLHTDMEREDIVLGPATWESVDEILDWLRFREEFEALPGIRKRMRPGFRALFHGAPGTGKTMVASWLGRQSGRPVYRIDLSMIVSKYIGETEKNLANVFRKAADKDWILFFDEADALFGRRTQVGNSNDRHANQEVSYLLQRVEQYPGLVVLASNFRDNLDEAFTRRFDVMAHFTIPSPHQRMALWQGAFSPALPVEEGLDMFDLARKHELSGGHITNAVRFATLKALRTGAKRVGLPHIQEGIRKEMQKLGIGRAE